jgi:hypothetical protein
VGAFHHCHRLDSDWRGHRVTLNNQLGVST